MGNVSYKVAVVASTLIGEIILQPMALSGIQIVSHHEAEITQCVGKHRYPLIGSISQRFKLQGVKIKTSAIHQDGIIFIKVLCLFHRLAFYLYSSAVVIEDDIGSLGRQCIDHEQRYRPEP